MKAPAKKAPSKPRVADTITRMLAQQIPQRHRVDFSPLENIGLASSLDLDKLHYAIRQAEAGHTQPLFAIYQEVVSTDNYIQALLDKRKRAALKDKISFPPADKNLSEDVEASTAANKMFTGYNPKDCEIDDWQLALGALMDGCVYPLVLVSKRFAPSTRAGLRYELEGLKLVDLQLLDWTQRKLMIADTDMDLGTRLGTFHAPDPAQYMKHQGHLMSLSGNRGGPMRSLLFWWLFAAMNRDWWGRFLDRFGAPFLVGKFNESDDEGKATLEAAFSAAARLLGVVVSSETEVEIHQASGGNATGEAFERFRDVARKELAILICGENLSSESDTTGLGSGVSDLQGETKNDMLDFDQTRLGMTLMRTVRQFLEINGYRGSVEVTFGGKKPADLVKLGGALASFKQAGIVIADESMEDLSAEAGFTLVKEAQATPGLPAPGNPSDPTQLPTSGSKKALAGIQIQAAQKVLGDVSAKQVSPTVGKRLLVSLGFDPTDAEDMIKETGAFKSVTTLSADNLDADQANSAAILEASAKLSRLMRENLAPVRQILADATGADDLEAKLSVFFADLSLDDRASVTEQLLTALAANGV